MAMKARHAFGSEQDISKALANGKIDAFDILFLDEKKVGWVTKEGDVVIAETDLSEVEAKIATKADAQEVETKLAEKADVTEVETELATKASLEEVDAKVKAAATDSVASANAYTDKMVEAAMGEHLIKKYEITDVPEGTIVNYMEHEIRVMCKPDAVFTKQNVGAGGDANSYYMTFKTYFPENAVGYIEHLNGQADEEILTSFSTDEYGKKYQPTWLALAKYDEATGTWNYYGKSSEANKYIGWDYQIDWYNADGVMIASDSVRINLSNENCHSVIEPYYVNKMMAEVETMVEEKVKEVESSYEIIEF